MHLPRFDPVITLIGLLNTRAPIPLSLTNLTPITAVILPPLLVPRPTQLGRHYLLTPLHPPHSSLAIHPTLFSLVAHPPSKNPCYQLVQPLDTEFFNQNSNQHGQLYLELYTIHGGATPQPPLCPNTGFYYLPSGA
ncbi:hypothetical protein HMI56_003688 [Coelomomyces lativittatus]|nr:hypothetical protein HMI56_003688 [Coelomomyces lativittatus]